MAQQHLTPLRDLLLELHQKLRDLVPNRKDLHTRLADDDKPGLVLSQSAILLGWIIEAAQALSMLESDVESMTTKSWIELAKNTVEPSPETTESTQQRVSFLISSLLYLIDKADRAQQEKDTFCFHTIVLPKLFHTEEGYQLERKYMTARFKDPVWPETQSWLRSLTRDMSNNDKSKLHNNSQRQKELIARGWIESIVFLKEQGGTFRLPEIFYLDARTLQAIRNVTRLAAGGCALGLHAAQMAKKSPKTLSDQESNGAALVRAMTPTAESASSYETKVGDTVIGLVKEWREEDSANLTEVETEALRQQTKKVLRGEDPVIQLLDRRMQTIFSNLAADYIQQGEEGSTNVSVKMYSGRKEGVTFQTAAQTPFAMKAQKAFESQGLALFASNLAATAELASRVPALAYRLYGRQIADIIESECSSATVD